MVTLSKVSTAENNDEYNHVAAILLLTREKLFQIPGNEVLSFFIYVLFPVPGGTVQNITRLNWSVQLRIG